MTTESEFTGESCNRVRDLCEPMSAWTPELRALAALTGFPTTFHQVGARVFCFAPTWVRHESEPSVLVNGDGSLYDFGSGTGGKPHQWYLDFLNVPRTLPTTDLRVKRAIRHFYDVAHSRGHLHAKDRKGGVPRPQTPFRRQAPLEKVVLPGSPFYRRAMAWNLIFESLDGPSAQLKDACGRRGIGADAVEEHFKAGKLCHFGTVPQVFANLSQRFGNSTAATVLHDAGLGVVRGSRFAPSFEDDCVWLITRYYHPVLHLDLPVGFRRRRVDGNAFFQGAKELALPNVFHPDHAGMPSVPLFNHSSASLWSRCSSDTVYLAESPLDCISIQIILDEWVDNARDAQARETREIVRSKITILGAYGAGAVKEQWCREIADARKVLICMDDDSAGRAASRRWSASLNRLRVPCEIVSPFRVGSHEHKDPNEALLAVHASTHPLHALDRAARAFRFEEVLHD